MESQIVFIVVNVFLLVLNAVSAVFHIWQVNECNRHGWSIVPNTIGVVFSAIMIVISIVQLCLIG